MKLVILDRDGVINEDSPDYIKSPDEWRAIPGSLDAIARLKQAGYTVCVATNQSGIARGLFDYDALSAIHDRMQAALAEIGARVDAVEFAPDHPDNPTPLRKPAPGMLLDIAARLQTSLEGVPVVGDSLRDIEAARAAGARPILVLTGNGRRNQARPEMADVETFDDLAGFVAALLDGDPSSAHPAYAAH
ncbi:MAG: D-glycero-beta-D-manno-heptose 1,7-bisphosphate 7-phosphatase [Nevskiaceae bacterium]|nr:MAG: D-glycero-beta-D-manno-heptose 1,7-bisphosphate 7-phosphatase [Nevskiaceae bacterium]TBR75014.1 MAG: D-glycero-beta-D-manno-heptose 1,7-bisphosphate 7-phosphatase [Nevskiaceae bacterium]